MLGGFGNGCISSRAMCSKKGDSSDNLTNKQDSKSLTNKKDSEITKNKEDSEIAKKEQESLNSRQYWKNSIKVN